MGATLVTKAVRSRIVVTEAIKNQPHALQLITAGYLIINFLELHITALRLNLTQALILIAIRELPESQAGPTAIARQSGLKRPSISRNLIYLEKRGLIREVTLTGKKPRFVLTASGIRTASKVDRAVAVIDQLIKDVLPAKEYDFLDKKMPRIVSDLRWKWAQS